MKAFHCLLLILSLTMCSVALAYQDVHTPKEALQRLLEGNERFVKDNSLCPDRNTDRRAASAAKQKPFAIILGCSDSRVPPELAFDQGIGDVFVVRVAGNVVGPTELDSVEYSAIYNGSSIVVVLGHESCGAIEAVLANNTKDIEAIANLIKPAVKNSHHAVNVAIEANVRNSVNRIKNSPPMKKLIKAGKIDVVGAYYELNSGKIRLLGTSNKS